MQKGRSSCTSASAPEQSEHQHEQIDEVEIQRQSAHDGLATRGSFVIVWVVHPFDPLSIVGSAACKHTDADKREGPVEPVRVQEYIYPALHRDSDQTHKQDRAESRQIPPRGIAQ